MLHQDSLQSISTQLTLLLHYGLVLAQVVDLTLGLVARTDAR